MDLSQYLNKQTDTAPVQEQAYSKEEYAAMKQAEREELWAQVDAHADEVFQSEENLRGFLSFMGQCSPQRTATLLLLHQQNPEITTAKTFDQWKAERRSIQAGAIGYTAILGQTYEKDGRKVSGYTIGKLYDISQTRGRPVPQPQPHEPDDLVAALIDSSPVHIEIADNLPDGIQAQYIPARRSIFVRNGMDAATTFCALARELAMAEYAYHNPTYSRQAYAAQSYCATYVAAHRNGLNTEGFRLGSILQSCSGLDAQGKRDFLSTVKSAVYTIHRNMERSLNAPQQDFEVDSFSVTTPEAKPKEKKSKTAPELS